MKCRKDAEHRIWRVGGRGLRLVPIRELLSDSSAVAQHCNLQRSRSTRGNVDTGILKMAKLELKRTSRNHRKIDKRKILFILWILSFDRTKWLVRGEDRFDIIRLASSVVGDDESYDQNLGAVLTLGEDQLVSHHRSFVSLQRQSGSSPEVSDGWSK